MITALKSSFTRYGIPEIVATDHGPQFSSQDLQVSTIFTTKQAVHTFLKVMARQKGGVKTVKNC
jgi:hypothetical protein